MNTDWQISIRELACRWLLEKNAPDSLPTDCLFLFGNPDLFKPSVLNGAIKETSRCGVFHTGVYKGREICYVTPKLGAAAVSIYLEVISQTSIKNLIAVGYAGGLREMQRVGDYFLPESASGLDGITKAYFGTIPDSSPDRELQSIIQSHIERSGFNFHTGAIVSIDTLTLETSAMIDSFRERGYAAIDMETGFFVTFCAREHLKCGVVHIFTDNAHTRDLGHGGSVRNAFHHAIRIAFDSFCALHGKRHDCQ